MKQKIFILFFLITFDSVFPQSEGRVTYKSYFAEKQATEELKIKNRIAYQNALDEEMMAEMLRFTLEFKGDESIFKMTESMISDAENTSRKEYVSGLFYGYDFFYIDKSKNLLIEQLFYSFGNLLRKRPANFVEWNLSNETKIIDGYTCYKATYTYIQDWKGSKFEWPVVAWYCPAIPISLGPTRYSGLPGLILELHEKQVGFIVEKIDFNLKVGKIIPPNDGEDLDETEIRKRDNFIKNN